MACSRPLSSIDNDDASRGTEIIEQTSVISSQLMSPLCPILEGFLPCKAVQDKSKCIVIAEGWPSWALVVGALGFECTHIFSNHRSISSFTFIPFTSPFDLRLVSTLTTFIFLSGSPAFIQHFWEALRSTHHLTVSLSLDSAPLHHWQSQGQWVLLRHCHYDGVTTGQWWCGSSQGGLSVPRPLYSSRRLRHILDPLLSGPTIQPPPDVHATLSAVHFYQHSCHPGGFWDIRRPHTHCICPCVFTKAWVHRPLVLSELLRAVDIPPGMFDRVTGCILPHKPTRSSSCTHQDIVDLW